MFGVPLLRCVSRMSQAQAARSASVMCNRTVPQLRPALVRFKKVIVSKMEISRASPTPITGHLDHQITGITRETPTEAQITAELFEVLCNFKDYKITRDSLSLKLTFVDDLGLDSLDLVEFVMVLEDHFEVDITDDEADDVRTLQDALDVLFVKIDPEK